MTETRNFAAKTEQIKSVMLTAFERKFGSLRKGHLVDMRFKGIGNHKKPGTNDVCFSVMGTLNDDVKAYAEVDGLLISGGASGIATCNSCQRNDIALDVDLGGFGL